MAPVLFAPPAAYPAGSEKAGVCMGRMTEGKPGGDHQIHLLVRPEKVVTLLARGFVPTACGKATNVMRSRQQMCDIALRSSPAMDADFKRIYFLTPSEICEVSRRD